MARWLWLTSNTALLGLSLPAFCLAAPTQSNENVNPQVLKRICRELKKLVQSPPEHIKIHINEDDITDIQATITGPEGTPYEGGHFKMKIVLGDSFPSGPPKGFFLTKIFHPNVRPGSGAICVNTLKKDWKPEYGIEHVLTVCKCLLIQPNAESALNEEAGKMLLEAYEDFSTRAKMMTELWAKPKAGDKALLSSDDVMAAQTKRDLQDGAKPVSKKEKKQKKAAKKKASGLGRL